MKLPRIFPRPDPLPPPVPPDPQHFADLFERYKNLVYRTAYLMTGDAAEADEALQEVFVRVYHALGAYDPQKGAFSTWLHRITINYCLGQRRRRRLNLQPLEESRLRPAPEGLETAVERSAEQQVMRQAIARLSPRQRSVLILRYFWDLPYAEIARILDLPLGTVKSRLDLALHSLRQQLAGQREEWNWGPPLPGKGEEEICS
jgi:RNA polymerase sigma-70 factor, ECF subfamily